VRENRTPGSVRGASGNRRPYRDGPRPTRVERSYGPTEATVVIGKIAFEFPIGLRTQAAGELG